MTTTIIDTVIRQDGLEVDGRRLTHEYHTDDTGIVHHYSYYALQSDDINTIAQARAAWLPGYLEEQELQRNLSEF